MEDVKTQKAPVIRKKILTNKEGVQLFFPHNKTRVTCDLTSAEDLKLVKALSGGVTEFVVQYELPDGTILDRGSLVEVDVVDATADKPVLSFTGRRFVDISSVSGSEAEYSVVPLPSVAQLSAVEKKTLSTRLKAGWGEFLAILAQKEQKKLPVEWMTKVEALISTDPISAMQAVLAKYGNISGDLDIASSHVEVVLKGCDDVNTYSTALENAYQELIVGYASAYVLAGQKIQEKNQENLLKMQKEHQLILLKKAMQDALDDVETELNGGVPVDETPKKKYSRLLDEKMAAGVLSEDVIKQCRSAIAQLDSPQFKDASEKALSYLLDQMPFGVDKVERPDISKVQGILDSGHYGLDEVKRRIYEQLVTESHVAKETGDGQYTGKPILLIGAPGIGKTTLTKSIAEATGRKRTTIGFGGVSDTSSLIGHKRTYTGAEAGSVVNAFMETGTMAPLVVLDEIDKTGQTERGNVQDVLMRLIDPHTNSEFKDEFLAASVDLSKAKFIATANYMEKLDPVLLDRFEVIILGGYSVGEKIEIAKRFVLPKEMEAVALTDDKFKVDDEVLAEIVKGYTGGEAGVRTLEKEIKKLCQKAVVNLIESGDSSVVLTKEMISNDKWLGAPRRRDFDVPSEDTVGWTTALAYSSVGGSAFPIKAQINRAVGGAGERLIIRNKKLGDDMQYSIDSVHTVYKDLLEKLITNDQFDEDAKADFIEHMRTKYEIHVDVTVDGPVDGPSAGVTFTTALLSRALNMPVDCKVAMTGKIDPLGNVKAIGGLDQKIPAARAAGMKTVIIPEENRGDYEKLKEDQKEGVDVVFASKIEDVLKVAIPGVENVIDFSMEAEQPKLPTVEALMGQGKKISANDNQRKRKVVKNTPQP